MVFNWKKLEDREFYDGKLVCFVNYVFLVFVVCLVRFC